MAQDGAVAMGGPPPAGRKMVNSFEPQRPCRVLESVWPGFLGAPCAGGLLRTGQLPWEVRCLLSGKMVDASEQHRPTWIPCGLASTVHPVLAGGSGRSSCLEMPTACWHSRWSILLSNGVPAESWSRCGLASTVHPVLVDGSGRCSFHGRCGTCWKEDS